MGKRLANVLIWFCRCGHLNLARDTKCARCGLARSLGERR
jgi:ribosomal protein L37E